MTRNVGRGDAHHKAAGEGGNKVHRKGASMEPTLGGSRKHKSGKRSRNMEARGLVKRG